MGIWTRVVQVQQKNADSLEIIEWVLSDRVFVFIPKKILLNTKCLYAFLDNPLNDCLAISRNFIKIKAKKTISKLVI